MVHHVQSVCVADLAFVYVIGYFFPLQMAEMSKRVVKRKIVNERFDKRLVGHRA